METNWTDFGIGLGACAVASAFFGTQFVPVKAFPSGDGVFMQWLMAVAIALVGLAVQCIRSFPPFHALPMLGGFLWATGNMTSVPIVREIGMGLGLLLWGFTNLVFGWASGRFGWFGLEPQIPASDLLNGFGLALSLLSTMMFGFVQNDKAEESVIDDDETPLLENTVHFSGSMENARRSIAIIVALLAGTFYGLSFTPVIYLQNNDVNASQNGLDYIFSFTCGILATSSLYFVIYCVLKRNKPYVRSDIILPGLTAGLIWGIAETAWFVANDKLSEAISFPIITRFPGVIAAIWGVFLFKEISGKKNLIILTIAIVVTVIGGVLSGLSKVIVT